MKSKLKISPEQEYQWNQNWANRIAHTDITLVIAELNDIYEARGELTAAFIVESSRNKASVLHNYFDWDDSSAANKWRLRQATKLLGCIEVKVITDNEPKIFRVFETSNRSIGDSQQASYTRFDINVPNQEYIKRLCINHLSSVQKRLSASGLFPNVLKKVETAIEELTKESTETKEVASPLVAVS